MLAGAQAVVPRPYTPGHLWELLHRSTKDLDDHARVTVGRIELDAGAYRVAIDGRRIADLPLLWEPGTAIGYHALTLGYILGEVAHRVTGRPIASAS